ncbi:hypothetical protein CGMCC3_g17641 [Colletotrichum fructicola]|nr:uncharacterized protein CGMCC3_g17641 [Colletotrichum fructicola]KAE9566187.1 hypothetical protein CGMCC3_g17641 [Colletotrichum fructicola]
MFVFSHCKMFEYTRRRTVREAFEGRLSVSCKHKNPGTLPRAKLFNTGWQHSGWSDTAAGVTSSISWTHPNVETYQNLELCG